MKSQMTVIRLQSESVADGGCHVFSPDVPYFHIVEENETTAIKTAVPVLKETLQKRLGCSVNLIIPRELQEIMEDGKKSVHVHPTLPPHIIAQLGA